MAVVVLYRRPLAFVGSGGGHCEMVPRLKPLNRPVCFRRRVRARRRPALPVAGLGHHTGICETPHAGAVLPIIRP